MRLSCVVVRREGAAMPLFAQTEVVSYRQGVETLLGRFCRTGAQLVDGLNAWTE